MAYGAGGAYDKRTSLKKGYGTPSPYQAKWVKERREAKKRNHSR